MALLRLLLYPLIFIILVASFLFSSGNIASADSPGSDIQKLTAGADSILVGLVTNQSSRWNNNHSRIETEVTLSVEKYLKNHGQNKITVTIPGGEVDGLTEHVSGTPVFNDGERVVLFVKHGAQKNEIYGQIKGKYTVKEGKVGDVPLPVFESRITQAMEGLSVSNNITEVWQPVQPEYFDAVSINSHQTEISSHVLSQGTGWETILSEDFEGEFPGSNWILVGNPTWGKTAYNAFGSSGYSVWCASGGSLGVDPQISNYPDNMSAWMIYGPFSLKDARAAQLTFSDWLLTQTPADYLRVYASLDGNYFWGYEQSGDYSSWDSYSFDLRNWEHFGDLCGQDQVWIAFRFVSDSSVINKGAFLDHVLLSQYIGDLPQITPSSASAGTGSQVTITGTGFGADPGKVYFFYRTGQPNAEASIISWSDTSIVAEVPVQMINNYLASASSGPVVVHTAAGLDFPAIPFEVTFSYAGSKWPAGFPDVNFMVNPNTADCTGEEIALQSAAATWSTVPDKNLSFIYSGTTESTSSSYNYQNEIMWCDLGSTGPLAQATWWSYGDMIIETDIEFNDALTWSTAQVTPVGQFDIQSTALHEFGHWLALSDLYGNLAGYPQDTSKVMYGFSGSQSVSRTLGDSEIAGIQWIYGNLTATINQSAAQSDPTNNSPINFTVVFNKIVDDFTSSDVTLSGTAGASTVEVSGSGTTYNVAVSGMTASGTVIASLAAGVCHDSTGNPNTASSSSDNEVNYDVMSPSVVISQAAGQNDPVNISPVNFAVAFSEPVISFDNTDVVLSGTAGATTVILTGSGVNYNLAVSGMTSDGTVIVNIPSGIAQDNAGNLNTASINNDNRISYDITPPALTIDQAVGQNDPANSSPVYITVVFSEAVFDFTSDDITLSGTAGASSVNITGGPVAYNLAVSGMTGDGTIVVDIAPGIAHDSAGNASTIPTILDNQVYYESSDLTVTINQANSQSDPVNTSPVNFTVIFSKPVSDFTDGDVILTGASSASIVITGSGTTYNVAVNDIPIDCTIISSIASGVAHDSAGNGNQVSTSLDNQVTYDASAPSVTLNQSASQADPAGISPVNFTAIFSEPVTGFDNTDVTLGGSAGATTVILTGSGTTYNLAVSGMTVDGTITVSLPEGIVQDAAGNFNTASTSTDNEVTCDITPPSVTIDKAVDQTDPASEAVIDFTVIFSEPVTGFTASDLSLSGTAGPALAVVTEISPEDGTTYNVAVSGMTSDGMVILDIPSGIAQDQVGHLNTVASCLDNQVTYDTSAPSVTLNQSASQADPAGISPVNFTVIFSEPVTGFDNTDVSLGGTAGATTVILTGSGANYNLAVSGMTSDGTVTASIGESTVLDIAGNPNTASTSTDNEVTYYISGLSVSLNQADSQLDPTNSLTINFTAIFTHPVTNFDNTDVFLSGTAGANTALVTEIEPADGTTYNIAVSGMTSDGTVIVSIPAGIISDSFDNFNTASESLDKQVTYDASAPSITLNQSAGQADPAGISPVNFTTIFSEPVTGFNNTDVTLGGTAGATTVILTGSGTTYNLAVSGMTSDGTITVSLLEGIVQDTAGNPNTASTSTDNIVTCDITPPSVTIDKAAGQTDPSDDSIIDFTVIFSEPVIGFTASDLTLGGTAIPTTAVVTGSGTTYNVAVSGMTSDGTVILDIPSGIAQDQVGHLNTVASSLDNLVIYDASAPSVTLNQSSGQADPAGISPVNFTAIFSEPVTGFENNDVTLGGTAGATTVVVTGSGTTYNLAVSGMSSDGTITVSLPEGIVQDAAGNPNTPSTSTDNTVTCDITPPSVTIDKAVDQTDPTNESVIDFTVIFSEPITGFTSSYLTLSGTAGPALAVVTEIDPEDGTTFNIAVSGMTSDGTVVAGIAAGVARDSAGNLNTASTSIDNQVILDTVIPSVTINQAVVQDDPAGVSPVNFTVVFSKPVTGFSDGEVNLSGTAEATTAVITGSGTTYNVAVSGMTSNGTIIAVVPAGVALDNAGNSNSASTSTDNQVTWDTSALSVTVNQASGQSDPVNSTPVNFTVIFNKPVKDFTGEDVTLSGSAGPTAVLVTGNGATYNVAVSGMVSDGTVVVNLEAGVVHDSAGNSNTASTSTDNQVVYDTTAPSVTINQAANQSDPTSTSPVKFTVNFSEPVSGFITGDVILSGTARANIASVSGSGAVYSIEAIGMSVNGTVIASIASGVAYDAAGNFNQASTSTDNQVTYNKSTGGGSSGGGSGGGGGGSGETTPVVKTVSLTGFSAQAVLKLDSQGKVVESSNLISPDGAFKLQIAAGTKLLDQNGNPLTLLSARKSTSIPDPPSGKTILMAYDFTPAKAAFQPSINLTYFYDTDSLTGGMKAEDLTIAYWNGSNWVPLPGTVNLDTNSISASVAHFTTFAVLVTLPLPPDFAVTDLKVIPETAKTAEEVTISVSVANNGGSSGKYKIVLTINDLEEAFQEVTLNAGSNTEVIFKVVKNDPGDYNVNVNGKTAAFTVKTVPNVIPPPETTVVPVLTPDLTPDIGSSTPLNAENKISKPFGFILLLVILFLIIICWVIYELVYRRNPSHGHSKLGKK